MHQIQIKREGWDTPIYAEIASTTLARARGLSGRKDILINEALLFVFPNSNRWIITTMGMKFHIDIIWLNSEGEVIYFIESASPSGFWPRAYKPPNAALFVLELYGGAVKRYKIRLGEKLINPNEVTIYG